MLATYITGSKSLGFVGYAFDDGILPIFSGIICGVILNFLFIARYIAPNILYFEGCLTAAEMMGRLYGQKARFLVGLLGAFYSVALVILQIIWLTYLGELINIPSQWSMLLGGTLVVIYSARGGIKSVAITDVLQFIALILFIPIVVNILFHKIGGIRIFFQSLPSINLNILHHPRKMDYIIYSIW